MDKGERGKWGCPGPTRGSKYRSREALLQGIFKIMMTMMIIKQISRHEDDEIVIIAAMSDGNRLFYTNCNVTQNKRNVSDATERYTTGTNTNT